MQDLISRQAAIEALGEPFVMSQCMTMEECDHMNFARALCIARIESIEAAQRWIPVTERMPDATAGTAKGGTVMGIYIPGVDMPHEGQVIVIDSIGGVWSNEWPNRGYTQINGAKAVAIPAHGRLVDADRLTVIAYSGTEGRPNTFDAGVEWLAEKIDALPTVIPEEEET